MRTLLKKEGSVVQDSSPGDGDKWIDLKDRVHELGDLDQGDDRRQIQVLWDLKLMKLKNSSRNDLLYKERSKNGQQSPRHCL